MIAESPGTVTVDPEFRGLIPSLAPDECRQLKANLRADGCLSPLVTWRGTLLDGHNRLEICEEHGLAYRTHEVDLPDRDAAKAWIIRNQFGRRNLTPYQRAELALELEPLVAARSRQGERTDLSQNSGKSESLDTHREVAKSAGVSHDTIAKVKHIRDHATDEVKQQLRDPNGGLSIHKAYQDLKTDERRIDRNVRNIQLVEVALDAGEVPPASVLLVDPPWKYDFSPTDSCEIENQYPTMTLEAICALDVAGVSTPDAVLFLWATSPKLAEAFEVLNSWGFAYRTCAIWDKGAIGCGYYFRQQHELLLVATRGKLPAPEPSTRPPSVFQAPRGKHSEKPEAVYEFIEVAYPNLSKRELFARRQRPGWLSAWGNQV